MASQTEIVRMMKQRKNEALLKIAEKHNWRWYYPKNPTMGDGGTFIGHSPELEKAEKASEKAVEAAKKAYVAALAKSGYTDTTLGNHRFYNVSLGLYEYGGKLLRDLEKESVDQRMAKLLADVGLIEAAFREAEENLMLMGSKEFADAFKAFTAALAKLTRLGPSPFSSPSRLN